MSKVPTFILAAVVLGLGAFAHAKEVRVDPDVLRKLEALEKEVKTLRQDNTSLKQEVNGLRSDQGGDWLNERRAEEVKSLIHEVLSDADTRASLLSDGAAAGYDGHFYIGSGDGKFRLNIMGHFQFRYIANFNQNPNNGNGDDEDEGFQLRRGKIQLGGYIMADKKIEYYVSIAADHQGDSEGSFGSGSIFLEDYWARTALFEGVTVQWGKFKLPFLREELVSSKRQLAVERASVTEFFTLNRAEQVQFGFMPMDNIRGRVSISDGANSETSDIGADGVEFAITARVDAALAGDLKQADDFAAWSGEPLSIVLGGAIHYQIGDAKNAVGPAGYNMADYFSWTIDGSVEISGFNVFASITGGHIDPDGAGGSRDMFGFLVQGGYMVIPDVLEPFARFEWIDVDVAGASDVFVLTFGANYYMKGHNAKFTLDIVWLVDGGFTNAGAATGANPFGASASSTGVGNSDGPGIGNDEILLRAQFQLLF